MKTPESLGRRNALAKHRRDTAREPVFEGAQGLLLDQSNIAFYPHVTRSNTGMQNVRILCDHAAVRDVDVYYVSRTYLTRHGNAPLPGEDLNMRFQDDTNLDHPYQGRLRFAPLDYAALRERCAADAGGRYKLVMTHCDQLDPGYDADLSFFGPTRHAYGLKSQSAPRDLVAG